MRIFLKSRDEARKLKSGSNQNLKVERLGKPTSEGFKWVLKVDNSK